MMYSVPIDWTVTERERWLAQIAGALEQAQHLLIQLEWTEERRPLLLDVHHRIEAAKLEIQSLRRSRSLRPRDEFDPDRLQFSTWTLG
jgi:acyl-CoA reductase-like NAD-dependent aldehyde dehydrogenase